MTQEQRMAYYKKKYGFEPSEHKEYKEHKEHKEVPKAPEKKKSFWNRVASIFKSGKGK